MIDRLPGPLRTMALLIKLGRFHFLGGGLLLFMFGATLALANGSDLDVPRLVFGYLVFFPAHLSVSYSNDYFDADADRYNTPSLFSGGSGVLTQHPKLRPVSKFIAMALIAIAVILSLVFTWHYSYPPWFPVLVVLGSLLGWFYAAPPARLSYRGLGEISTAFTAGFLIPCMGFIVVRGALSPEFLLMSFPMLFFGLVFITSVQMPDREADLKGDKRTLVVKAGRRRSYRVIGISSAIATAALFLLSFVLQDPGYKTWVIGLFSLLVTIIAAVAFLVSPEDRKRAVIFTNITLVLYIGFLTITDAYLLAESGII